MAKPQAINTYEQESFLREQRNKKKLKKFYRNQTIYLWFALLFQFIAFLSWEVLPLIPRPWSDVVRAISGVGIGFMFAHSVAWNFTQRQKLREDERREHASTF